MLNNIEEKANKCFHEQIDPETSEFECFFHYTDDKLFKAGFQKGYEKAFDEILNPNISKWIKPISNISNEELDKCIKILCDKKKNF
jgi:hypothetical protein